MARVCKSKDVTAWIGMVSVGLSAKEVARVWGLVKRRDCCDARICNCTVTNRCSGAESEFGTALALICTDLNSLQITIRRKRDLWVRTSFAPHGAFGDSKNAAFVVVTEIVKG